MDSRSPTCSSRPTSGSAPSDLPWESWLVPTGSAYVRDWESAAPVSPLTALCRAVRRIATSRGEDRPVHRARDHPGRIGFDDDQAVRQDPDHPPGHAVPDACHGSNCDRAWGHGEDGHPHQAQARRRMVGHARVPHVRCLRPDGCRRRPRAQRRPPALPVPRRVRPRPPAEGAAPTRRMSGRGRLWLLAVILIGGHIAWA